MLVVRIDLTELLRKVGEEADIDEEARVTFPEDGLILTKPVNVKLHLVNTGESVLLDGTLQAIAELECSRCLKKIEFPISIEVSEEYSKAPPPSEARRGKGIELKEEDFVYPIGADNTLDLGEIIRQNLLLALPLKPLCSKECAGPG